MYFCAFGLVAALPFAYLFCQVLTFVVYEGRWRLWCLVPLPIVVVSFTPLLFWHTPAAIVGVTIGAPLLGIVALAFVWGLYSKSAQEARDAAAAAESAPDAAADA